MPSRLPLTQLAVLGAALFAAVITELLPVGLLPQLADAFDVGERQVGWWVSAYALVVAGAAIPLTALLARWPRRQALLVLLAVYAAGNALILVAPAYWVGLAGRILGGVAHAGIFSVAFASAASLAPPGRAGRAVAIVNAGVAPAWALGLPAATAAGTAWGWRWPFAAAIAVIVLLAVAVARFIPAPPPITDSPAAASTAASAATPSSAAPSSAAESAAGRQTDTRHMPADRPSGSSGVLASLRGRGLQLIGLTTVVLTIGHYSAYTYVTPLLLRAGVEQSGVSLILLGYGVASSLGLFLAGAFVDRHLGPSLRVAIAVTAAALLAIAALTHSVAGTVAVVLVWGVSFSALPILINTAALRVSAVPDAAPAVVNAMWNVGIASGAWVGGLALQSGGSSRVALVAGLLVTSSLVLTGVRSAWRAGERSSDRPADAPSIAGQAR
ncbi:MFS transporter [Actinoplanes sp. NBRC 103695]|uniref:MFS transporter n=1 Tax=Actinoplanes sp. NBRC 103695 TaxID=3032202 RepID=UPI0024A0AEA4|nr:MFS transporter [Actinoplanes sp. NBRC 103695]GLY92865.1 MFS transporter [Actinoplanes sp. NBRC 103695]